VRRRGSESPFDADPPAGSTPRQSSCGRPSSLPHRMRTGLLGPKEREFITSGAYESLGGVGNRPPANRDAPPSVRRNRPDDSGDDGRAALRRHSLRRPGARKASTVPKRDRDGRRSRRDVREQTGADENKEPRCAMAPPDFGNPTRRRTLLASESLQGRSRRLVGIESNRALSVARRIQADPQIPNHASDENPTPMGRFGRETGARAVTSASA